MYAADSSLLVRGGQGAEASRRGTNAAVRRALRHGCLASLVELRQSVGITW
jgi:hypothetical protein